MRLLARLSLGIGIVLIPFRYRFLILSRPFPPVYQDYTDFLFFASDACLIACLAIWLISLLVQPRSLRTGPFFLSIPLAGVTIAASISAFTSVDPALSLYHAVRLILLFGLYVYVCNEIASPAVLLLPVSLQIIIQGSVSIGQVMGQHSLGLTAFGELALDPSWKGVSIVWAEGIRSLRAYGLSDHPNILGGCLAFGLLLVAGSFLSPSTRWRLLLSATFALGSLGLLLTFSRSAWLALICGVLVFLGLLWLDRQRQSIVQLGSLFASALIMLLPFLWMYSAYLGVRLGARGSFQSVPQEVQAIGERALLITTSNKLFTEHALTGVGLGALPLAMLQAFPEFPVNYQPAHFTLLDAAAETGLVGGMFYLILLVSPWLALWLNRRNLQLTLPLITASGLLAASLVIGFFDYYTWLLAPGRFWQWLIWGLWAAAYQAALTSKNNKE